MIPVVPVVVVAVAAVAVAVAANRGDRVGLGWRPQLAAGIVANLDAIDVVEVVADNYFSADLKSLQALRFLNQQVPLSLHGVGLGLASVSPTPQIKLDKMARLVNIIEPEFWSEHLAFVRAGNIEIGHLAAPPRNDDSIAGAVANIQRAAATIGSLPQLENIATLFQPPASNLTEVEWINQILFLSDTTLLLDLHNLYANAVNFGVEPENFLRALPLDRVHTVHLSGGHWIAQPDGLRERLLDDHVHCVPQAVFDLLKQVASLCPNPLTVLVERDGKYPAFSQLLEQLALARSALAQGRLLLGGRDVSVKN